MSTVDRKASRGGFLKGLSHGSKNKVSCKNYLRKAENDKFSRRWNSAETKEEMVREHEKAVREICDIGGKIKFEYAVNKDDLTKGSSVVVSEISNLLRDAIDKGWFSAMSGITDPWTFISGCNGRFQCHPENSDLLSFNVNVKGGTKVWVIILLESRQTLEDVTTGILLDAGGDEKDRSRNTIGSLFRHKEFFFPLSFLDKYRIKYYLLLQEVGTVVVTLQRCLHFGWNWGHTVNGR